MFHDNIIIYDSEYDHTDMMFSKTMDKCKVGAFVINRFDHLILAFLILALLMVFMLVISIITSVKQYKTMSRIQNIGENQSRLNQILTTLSVRNVMSNMNVENERDIQNTRILRILDGVKRQ